MLSVKKHCAFVIDLFTHYYGNVIAVKNKFATNMQVPAGILYAYSLKFTELINLYPLDLKC